MILDFVKPQRCDMSGPNCVEVAQVDGNVFLRDSKTQGTLGFSAAEFDAFVQSAKAGQYDTVV